MRAALAQQLSGIDGVELGELPDPVPAAGQALIRVHGAGVGPWDVGFLGGGFPGLALPFVPGQEVAGVVEAVGDGAGIQPGERVYATLFPAGGGFAELAPASADRLAPMPGKANFVEAAGLVIGAGTAYEGLVDREGLQAGETVLITAAAGGVGSAAVQIAAAVGARVVAVASPSNHDYLLSLGASEVFDYHAADWAQQVRAVVPGGVDLLFDGAGGQTVIRPSMLSATAAGRFPSSCKALPFSWSGASPANHSLPMAVGPGLSNWPPWSMPANSARRPKRYCRSTRPARRWRGSLPGTLGARSRSKSADCAQSGRLEAWVPRWSLPGGRAHQGSASPRPQLGELVGGIAQRGRRSASSAGSIPVRLRHHHERATEQKSSEDELLAAVDVVGRAGERRVGHHVDGERGDVGGADDAADRQCRPQLIAAFLESIAEQ